jgi:hypothetical protein
LEYPHHHAERRADRDDVHRDRLERQHDRAEGEEQQQERDQADVERHPPQAPVQAGELVDVRGRAPTDKDLRPGRRRQIPQRGDEVAGRLVGRLTLVRHRDEC